MMHCSITGARRRGKSCCRDDKGIALILVLVALAILSLLGLFMALKATTGLHISDNHESRVRSTYAAMAGLNHARALMRGLDNDAFLRGPDGTYNPSPSYLEQAKQFRFRNPLPVVQAHALDITDPGPDVSGLQDDGVINTGFYYGIEGISLIPLSGIAQKAPDSGEPGETVLSRYFVKVTDNNGENSEIAGDPDDNPFVDGDGVVIVRSMGISKTFSDRTGSVPRRNSVVVFEARYRRFSVFDSGPAMLVLGSGVRALFEGTYDIAGGFSPGIGVVDTDTSDALLPGQIIRAGPFGEGNISGSGIPAPSIADITDQVRADRERSMVLNPQFLWDFVFNKAPQFSDNYSDSDQDWNRTNAPDIGTFDSSKPSNAPGQDPKLTVVHGNLRMSGDLSGGGLLVVTGNLEFADSCNYTGLVLVIGAGRVVLATNGGGISGGVVVASLGVVEGNPVWGDPDFTVRGNSRIAADENAVKAALSLVPPIQTSFREITGVDP